MRQAKIVHCPDFFFALLKLTVTKYKVARCCNVSINKSLNTKSFIPQALNKDIYSVNSNSKLIRQSKLSKISFADHIKSRKLNF